MKRDDLRKVKVSGASGNKEGWFHGWTNTIGLGSEGTEYTYKEGIVELGDGKLKGYGYENIQFID
ncbi:MAG TPA: hypothetical protein VJ951_00400 [Bacteroidales bacterium]|nr:hypothetical protein [Bacteroidales bacterium]